MFKVNCVNQGMITWSMPDNDIVVTPRSRPQGNINQYHILFIYKQYTVASSRKVSYSE